MRWRSTKTGEFLDEDSFDQPVALHATAYLVDWLFSRLS